MRSGGTMNEASWRRLVRQIRDDKNDVKNLVVPVVGSQLLVGADGGSSLYAPIARRLLKNYGLEPGPLPPFRELNEAVTRIRAANPPGFNADDRYGDTDEAMSALTAAGDAAIPESIRQLAKITDFRLIVTLTPDDLLARSLRQRCRVNEIVHTPRRPTTDLPVDWNTRSDVVHLLYLFGKLRSGPTFPTHDEAVLEYAHNVLTHGDNVLNRLLGALTHRTMLFIGCNFPDWLSRFFLRVTNAERLSKKDKREWMIEQPGPEESLTSFLRSHSKATEILTDTSPVEFVGELYRR